jgi:hypothetical protein
LSERRLRRNLSGKTKNRGMDPHTLPLSDGEIELLERTVYCCSGGAAKVLCMSTRASIGMAIKQSSWGSSRGLLTPQEKYKTLSAGRTSAFTYTCRLPVTVIIPVRYVRINLFAQP